MRISGRKPVKVRQLHSFISAIAGTGPLRPLNRLRNADIATCATTSTRSTLSPRNRVWPTPTYWSFSTARSAMRRLNGALTIGVREIAFGLRAQLGLDDRRWVGSSDRVFSVFCTAMRALSMVRSALSTSLFDAVPLFDSSPILSCSRCARRRLRRSIASEAHGVFLAYPQFGKFGPGLCHLQFVVDRVDAEQRGARGMISPLSSRGWVSITRPATCATAARRVPVAPRHSPGPEGHQVHRLYIDGTYRMTDLATVDFMAAVAARHEHDRKATPKCNRGNAQSMRQREKGPCSFSGLPMVVVVAAPSGQVAGQWAICATSAALKAGCPRRRSTVLRAIRNARIWPISAWVIRIPVREWSSIEGRCERRGAQTLLHRCHKAFVKDVEGGGRLMLFAARSQRRHHRRCRRSTACQTDRGSIAGAVSPAAAASVSALWTANLRQHRAHTRQQGVGEKPGSRQIKALASEMIGDGGDIGAGALHDIAHTCGIEITSAEHRERSPQQPGVGIAAPAFSSWRVTVASPQPNRDATITLRGE